MIARADSLRDFDSLPTTARVNRIERLPCNQTLAHLAIDDGDGVEDGGAHLVRLLHVELLHLIAHIEPFASESHGERVWTDGMGDGQVEERSRDGEGGRRQGDQGVGRWRCGVAVTGGLQGGGARGEDVELGGEVEVDRAVAVVQQVQLHLGVSGVKFLFNLSS